MNPHYHPASPFVRKVRVPAIACARTELAKVVTTPVRPHRQLS